MADPVFRPIASRTLKEDIAQLLADSIFANKFRPGQRLNESELARQLHVSRAPIREALQQLQEQGLIVNTPRRGMFIVSLSDADMLEINRLRLLLEAEALRLAQANLNRERERRLGRVLAEMEALNGSALDATRLDLEFHRTIWSFTGNKLMEKVLNSITAPLFACATLRKSAEQKQRAILDSHRPLFDYVRGKNKKTAEQVMASHLEIGWGDQGRVNPAPD